MQTLGRRASSGACARSPVVRAFSAGSYRTHQWVRRTASARPHLNSPTHTRWLTASASAGGGTPGGSGGSSSGGGGGDGSADSNGAPAPGPHPMRPWTFVLALLLAVGGAMGYIKKGSTKSLGGGVSGAVILALAARSMTGATALSGARVAFFITLLLGIFFVSRYTKTKKIMPAGLGAGVCLGYAAAFVATGI